MNLFSFRGELPTSKSVLLRQQLLQSFNPSLVIQGHSSCDDVRSMTGALAALKSRQFEIPCGEAGLVFRLMLGRVSRVPGEYLLTGSSRLLKRPHGPMLSILERLGVRIRVQDDGIYLATQGWKNPASPVEVSRSVSSQFASSILLNAWNLDFPLELKWPEATSDAVVSTGYFEISQKYALQLGMKILPKENGLEILPHAQTSTGILEAEMDYSSAFAIAAIASVAGTAEILNADENSSQPDSLFEKVLAQMGVEVRRNGKNLSITAPQRLLPVNVNLSQSPDLFPVLAVLCAFAEGESELSGAPHLVHKESDRIAMSAKLLGLCGRRVQRTSEGMKIFGMPPGKLSPQPFDFDPGEDHRMVMAAAVVRWAGLPIRVLNPYVVNKSFPEFVAIARLEHSA